MTTAFLGEPSVDRGDVLVQQTVEAARPRLRDALLAEFGDERGGVVATADAAAASARG